MRIDFTKADGSFSYVHYNQFKVRSASEEYKLTVDGYTGVDENGVDNYEIGFGNLSGKFWYGLKGISCLTQTVQWKMRLDIQNADKTWTYLHYNNFRVGTASDGYPLSIGGYTLRGTDYFARLNGRKFSTSDVGNDTVPRINCAATQQARWWYYNSCNVLNLNRQPPVLYP
ncbi:fibrinogen C domain-containing protein 1-B-like [Dysidea avara]|uniref:fibrinogen C domain-containing protein 1-B-like n=1 Tax=Dysidea avara TaxID=196820 RepID=UPI0033298039